MQVAERSPNSESNIPQSEQLEKTDPVEHPNLKVLSSGLEASESREKLAKSEIDRNPQRNSGQRSGNIEERGSLEKEDSGDLEREGSLIAREENMDTGDEGTEKSENLEKKSQNVGQEAVREPPRGTLTNLLRSLNQISASQSRNTQQDSDLQKEKELENMKSSPGTLQKDDPLKRRNLPSQNTSLGKLTLKFWI